MIDEKKLLDELVETLERAAEDDESCTGIDTLLREAADAIESLSAKLEEPKWIPCSDRLPEEPEVPPHDTLRTQIREGSLQEYIVMIYGAIKPTTLWYIGDGVWYDPYTEQGYLATAWRPLPEPYKPDNQAAVQEGDNP